VRCSLCIFSYSSFVQLLKGHIFSTSFRSLTIIYTTNGVPNYPAHLENENLFKSLAKFSSQEINNWESLSSYPSWWNFLSPSNSQRARKISELIL
jgi:hypothetical protein